ncbi:phospholipase A1-like [Lingula anatina]|uniref:Phospholipase A1-like n=1 Tax=Lingula anatina TaxID=7574 RepID=A0A1S3JY32_LINAN|nr:phospholipase A1-like [Lingula anatina]|eukprot:XP_013414959.1 phospholipase A1-like [Lingula anatina]
MCDRLCLSCPCFASIGRKLSAKRDQIFDSRKYKTKQMEEKLIQEIASGAPVDKIKPTLFLNKHDQGELKVEYQTTVAETVDKMRQDGFLATSKLVFIVHGYRDNAHSGWLVEAKDNLLEENPDQTVVLVDWSRGADTVIYPWAAADTATVGAWLGEVADGVRSKFPEMKIWSVGHSLGAHLVGSAGRHSKGAIHRVTGLDPAGPLFEKYLDVDKRLRPTDAAMVDVIHTDGYETNVKNGEKRQVSVLRQIEGELSVADALVNHFGTLIPLGTIDFYPNYGYEQPGVAPFQTSAQHHRAVQLFNWSIKNKGKFMTNQILDGTPAFEKPVKKLKTTENWAEMGCYADQSFCDRGLYFIRTNPTIPWAPATSETSSDTPSAWGCNIL